MKKDSPGSPWKKIQGKMKDQASVALDDELNAVVNGHREQFSDLVQNRYSITKEEADKQFDTIKNQHEAVNGSG